MCDFKPGDEVVVVDDDGGELGRLYDLWLGVINPQAPPCDLEVNERYVVRRVFPHPHIDGLFGVEVNDTGLFPHFMFRKVQRRDLSIWLKTSVPNTDHLDKPLPAKKRERVE